jgi:hypothetical protein
MTNTYTPDEDDKTKIAEELRLIRCCLERILRSLSGDSLFVDYEMEKFRGRFIVGDNEKE